MAAINFAGVVSGQILQLFSLLKAMNEKVYFP